LRDLTSRLERPLGRHDGTPDGTGEGFLELGRPNDGQGRLARRERLGQDSFSKLSSSASAAPTWS
jgi:hypothetical protein